MPNLESLGSQIGGGHADLVANAAPQREKILELFLTHLNARQIPDVTMKPDTISTNGKSRDFYFIRHRSGALMTVALRVYGNDLLLKWNLWFKGSVNWRVIFLAAGCALVGLVFFAQNMPLTILGAPVLLFALGIVLNAARKGNLTTKLDFLSVEDLTALNFATHASLQWSLEQVGIEYKLRDLLNGNLSSEPMKII